MTNENDRLEEIRKHCASISVWEDEIIEYADVEWLITEVESLRGQLKEANTAYDTAQSQIQSLQALQPHRFIRTDGSQ